MDATPESGTATPIFDAVASLLREQSAFALATVVAGPGAGAKLLIRPEGTMGTLGDANLDRVVERDALGELAAGRSGVGRSHDVRPGSRYGAERDVDLKERERRSRIATEQTRTCLGDARPGPNVGRRCRTNPSVGGNPMLPLPGISSLPRTGEGKPWFLVIEIFR